MMRLALILAALLSQSACFDDETLRAYGAADKVWRVTELNNAPFNAIATLTFPEAGRIAGQAPCNAYFAEMSVPYPWFEAGPIGASKRACPDLAAEGAFFDALRSATLSEVLGNTMVLSTDAGPLLVFTADG